MLAYFPFKALILECNTDTQHLFGNLKSMHIIDLKMHL